MKIAATCLAGPVPVKREGEVVLSTVAADTRRDLVAAVAAVRGEHRSPETRRSAPDVGGCTLRVEEPSGEIWEWSFSDASATQAERHLLTLLRPYLKIVPWR